MGGASRAGSARGRSASSERGAFRSLNVIGTRVSLWPAWKEPRVRMPPISTSVVEGVSWTFMLKRCTGGVARARASLASFDMETSCGNFLEGTGIVFFCLITSYN